MLSNFRRASENEQLGAWHCDHVCPWGGLQEVAAASASAIVVLVALTALQMVLGELVPKSLTLQYPTQTALATFTPMRWSLSLLSWFIAVLNGSDTAILKLLRIPEKSHRHIHSPEEIALLITESRDGGLLAPDEQHRLHQALTLSVRPVRQLMTPRAQVVAVDGHGVERCQVTYVRQHEEGERKE